MFERVNKATLYLKCRFCGWSTVKVFRTKKGRTSGAETAHSRLRDHVADCHPEEFEKIQALLSDELADSIEEE